MSHSMTTATELPAWVPKRWLEIHHSIRGGRYVPIDNHDPAAEWKKALKKPTRAQAALLESTPFGAFQSMSPDDAVDFYVKVRAAAASSRGDKTSDALVCAILGAFGVVTATRAVASTPPPRYSIGREPGLVPLRRALAAADEATYAEARSLFPEGDLRSWFLFPKTLNRSPSTFDPPGSFETLVIELGEKAVPLIADTFRLGSDERSRGARVLAYVPYASAFNYLLDNLDLREVKREIDKVPERFPEQLAQIVAGRSEPQVRALVEKWCATTPVFAKAMGRNTPEPETGSPALPRLFQVPPWEEKRPKGPRPLTLTPDLPTDIQFAWTEVDESLRDELRKRVNAWTAFRHLTVWADVAGKLAMLKWAMEQDEKDAYLDELKQCPPSGREAQELVVGMYHCVGLSPEVATDLLLGLDFRSTYPYLVPVGAPAIADRVRRWFATKRYRKVATAWMTTHPEYAARALLPWALGRAGVDQNNALSALRYLASEGHRAEVDAAARRYGSKAVAALEAHLQTDPLHLMPSKPPKTISFWNPVTLARPRTREGSIELLPEQAEIAAKVCAVGSGEVAYVGVDVLRDALDPESLRAFSWSLFEQWDGAGAPSKESWAISQLKLFGDDDTVDKLEPFLHRWVRERRPRYAAEGIEVLRAIGTDRALQKIYRLADSGATKKLRSLAAEAVDEIATNLGMTSDELSDRTVPHLGLDDHGTLAFDYGERVFTVDFDERLQIVVRDASGTAIGRKLPEPTDSEDEYHVEDEQQRLGALRRGLRDTASVQLARLERAMGTARRWEIGEFDSFFVDHPLMRHLARRLVWGIYGEDDTLQEAFRLTPDRRYVAHDDRVLTLDGGTIGIVHPADLDASELQSWRAALQGKELYQPFPQVDRPVFTLPPGVEDQTAFVFFDQEAPTRKLRALQKNGWVMGPVLDFSHYWLDYPLPDGRHAVRLWLGDEGLATSSEYDDGPVDIEAFSVLPRGRNGYERNNDGTVPLGHLPASLVSEVLMTVNALCQP